MLLHTYVSDEARAMYCTPPEKCEPKSERLSEYQWAVQATGSMLSVCKPGWGTMIFLLSLGSRE